MIGVATVLLEKVEIGLLALFNNMIKNKRINLTQSLFYMGAVAKKLTHIQLMYRHRVYSSFLQLCCFQFHAIAVLIACGTVHY